MCRDEIISDLFKRRCNRQYCICEKLIDNFMKEDTTYVHFKNFIIQQFP